MKILSLIETMNHGGAETVATDLALGLSGHDLRFYHYSAANGCVGHAPFIERLKLAGIPVFDIHWSNLQCREGREQLLGDWRPDLVLFHWWRSHPIGIWIEQAAAEKNSDRPVFVNILHHQGDPGGPLYDHYVAVTPSQIAGLCAVKRERTTLIPNGIDLRPYTDLQRQAGGKRFVIGRISSLRAGKIPTDWVHTASQFDIADAHWVIAGDGVLREPLALQAHQFGVANGFSFPGYVSHDRRCQVLSGFDLCCYVTGDMSESHPLALLEATAAGLPIVAETRGGIPDIVKHGVNGLLGSSTAEIGTHLHRLRKDAGLRSSYSSASREIAAGFTLERQLVAYDDLFAKLLA